MTDKEQSQENLVALEARLQQLENQAADSVAAKDAESQQEMSSAGNGEHNGFPNLQPLVPFQILYNPEDKKRYLFVPKGCILVGKDMATFSDADEDDCVDIENLLGSDSATVYCHVKYESGDDSESDESESGYQASFSASSSGDDDYIFPVVRVSSKNIVNFCYGTISLGGAIELECGEHSKIVFTGSDDTESDSTKNLKQPIKIDVYYR